MHTKPFASRLFSGIITSLDTLTGWPGRLVLSQILYVIDLVTFSALAIRDWLNHNRLFESRSYTTTVAQIIFTGVDALPAITFLGLVTGMVFTFRLLSLSSTLGGSDDLIELLITVICLSIGPFLSAIIISRTGAGKHSEHHQQYQ